MGCKCCVPAAMKVLPGDILPNLPENIIHINESTSKEQREEFEQVIAKSFCGTTKTSPEGMIGWFFEGEIAILQYEVKICEYAVSTPCSVP